MITKEEIICGTKEELIKYFRDAYDLLNTKNKNTVLPTYTFDKDVGTIESQLNLFKCSCGCVFLLQTTEPSELQLIKFWVFIRAPKTEET